MWVSANAHPNKYLEKHTHINIPHSVHVRDTFQHSVQPVIREISYFSCRYCTVINRIIRACYGGLVSGGVAPLLGNPQTLPFKMTAEKQAPLMAAIKASSPPLASLSRN